MPRDMRDIVAASICKFNVSIGIDGNLAPEISTEECSEQCGYCRIAAEYICNQIEEGSYDKQSAQGFCGKAGKA